MSPIPTKTLPDTEARIRAAQVRARPLTDGVSEETRRDASSFLARTNDLATGYWRTTSDPRIAQINAAQALRRQLITPGRITQQANANAENAIAAKYPIFAAYMEWLRSRPPGSDTSPSAFVNTLR